MSDWKCRVRRLAWFGLIMFVLANIPMAQPLFVGQVGQSILLNLRIPSKESKVVASGWTSIMPEKRITWLCQPILVVVNARYAPLGAVKEVKQALIVLSQITGVSWKYAGTTHQLPDANHLVGGPVLVSWLHGGAKNKLGVSMINPEVSGTSGPYFSRNGSHWSSGFVTLNVDKDFLYTPGFGIGRTRGALILHELGHVAGLGHVKNDNEIMSEYSSVMTRLTSYGPGDIQGLRRQFPKCDAKG